MNRLTIQDGRIFLDDKEIQCVEEFNLKSSTDGTAKLSLKILVDLISMRMCQHGGNDLSSDLCKKAKKCHPIWWKIGWRIQWFFPCTYIEEYKCVKKSDLTFDHSEVHAWRQWFGRVLWERKWTVT